MVKHWCLVWTLCEALWGHLKELAARLDEPSEYVLALERRKAFSRWLSQTASERVEEEVSLCQQDSPAEAVFSYLTGKRIGEACTLAQTSGKGIAVALPSPIQGSLVGGDVKRPLLPASVDGGPDGSQGLVLFLRGSLALPLVSPFLGDHRLALLLSQLAGSQDVRELLALQLADWHQLHADSFIQEERLRIFALLAGKPVGYTVVALLAAETTCLLLLGSKP